MPTVPRNKSNRMKMVTGRQMRSPWSRVRFKKMMFRTMMIIMVLEMVRRRRRRNESGLMEK